MCWMQSLKYSCSISVCLLYCVIYLSFALLLLFPCCHLFFFSSRRRHTRYIGDWSSDVCSSDLTGQVRVFGGSPKLSSQPQNIFVRVESWTWISSPMTASKSATCGTPVEADRLLEIGRASCRERE